MPVTSWSRELSKETEILQKKLPTRYKKLPSLKQDVIQKEDDCFLVILEMTNISILQPICNFICFE